MKLVMAIRRRIFLYVALSLYGQSVGFLPGQTLDLVDENYDDVVVVSSRQSRRLSSREIVVAVRFMWRTYYIIYILYID